MADHLDDHGAGKQSLPGLQQCSGSRGAAMQEGPTHVGVGAQQDHQRAHGSQVARGSRCGVGEDRRKADRLAALAAQVGGRDHMAQRRPA
jgi:hypothetical protein